MKTGVSWNIRGVRADARDTAREAARRSGMSVGDWLNTAIVQSAADDGVLPQDLEPQADNGEIASINERLDQLTQQIERMISLPPAPAPPPRGPDDWGLRGAPPPPYFPNPQPQPSFQPYGYGAYPAPSPDPYRQAFDPYIPPMPAAPASGPAIDDAIAEIIARQQALDGDPIGEPAPQPPMPAEMPPPSAWAEPQAPLQHEPLRHTPIQHAPLQDAPAQYAPVQQAPQPLPQPAEPRQPEPRHAPPQQAAPQPAQQQRAPQSFPSQNLSGLEAQLRSITEQIEGLHQSSSIDVAVAALREDLTEIARAILDAMPRQAVEALENEVRALSQKIEQTRQVGVDPGTIASVEHGLAEVRDALRGLTPAENLTGFAEAVTSLSHKIDQIGGGGTHDPAALNQLDAAIDALRGIVSHVASNETLSRLAEEMHGLSAKIDRVGASGAGMSVDAFSALENRIGALTEQLKHRSDGNALPPQLDDVIRNLTDRLERVHLNPGDTVALGHLEDRIVNLVEKLDASEARLSHLSAVERGLADLLVHLEELRADKGTAGLREPAAPNLEREVARAQDSIEDVHGTLGHVVDRLAMIETDIRGEAPRPTVTTSARPVVVNPIAPPEPASRPAVQRPNPAAVSNRAPIDPNLPPDYPLEPGSGVPHIRAAPSAAERIAASEAALDGVKPTTANPGHSNFIAAARRAAAQTGSPGATITPAPAETDEKPAGKDGGSKTMGKRVRSLLAGLSAIILIFGAIRVATNLLDGSDDSALEAPATQETPRLPAAPGRQSSLPSANDILASGAAPASAPPPAMPQWLPDVTGSIQPRAPAVPARSSALPQTPPLAPAAPSVEVDKLPAPLRTAMARGDATAEFEAGLRYLEGRGVAVNLEEAARWLDRAAKAGLAPAQFRLGSLYEKGQGVKKDLEAARKLYISAADKGNAKAMHNLAVLHAEGIDGKADYKVAAQWFRKGADRGIGDSQYNLGILYARGIGVEQNLVESYKWFALAANQGDKDSGKKRDEIAQRIDQQSLITARLAVQTWMAEPQPDEAINVKAPAGGWDREASPPAKKQRASLAKIGQQ